MLMSVRPTSRLNIDADLSTQYQYRQLKIVKRMLRDDCKQ